MNIIITKMDQLLMYTQIEKNLDKQFDTECPPKNANESIMTDKKLILDEFQKWYNFWDSRDPILSNPDINQTNNLLLIKKQICEARKIGILKEIENIGLKKEFFERMNHK